MAVKFGSILELNNATKEATLDANNLRGTTIQVDEFNSASLATIGFGLTTAPGKRRLGTIVATTGSLTTPVKYYAFTHSGSGDSNLSGSEWTDLSNWEEIMLSSNTGSFTFDSPFTAAGISGSWQSQHFQLSSGTASFTNITASGDITASKVRANEYTSFEGNILVKETLFVPTSTRTLTIGHSSTNIINYKGVTSNMQGSLNVTGLANIPGNITASGNISASGAITASNLSGVNTGDQDLSSYALISEISGAFNGQTGSFLTELPSGVYSSSLQTLGNITSSGNISGSGNLFANLSEDDGSNPNTVVYDTTSGQFYYTGSYGSGGGSDNLGNHTATQDLDLSDFSINQVNTITLGTGSKTAITSSGRSLFIGPGSTADQYWKSFHYGAFARAQHKFTGSLLTSANITASAGITANDLRIGRQFGDEFPVGIQNNPTGSSWAGSSLLGQDPGVPFFAVKPSLANANVGNAHHQVNVVISGSDDIRLYKQAGYGDLERQGTYSPPTTGVLLETVSDDFVVTGGIGTRVVVVELSGDFGNITTNNLVLKKIEARGNMSGTSRLHRNVTIGGELIMTRFGNANTGGVFRDVWDSATPNTNPWIWATWVVGDGDPNSITVENGEVDTSFTLNGSPPNITYRLTFEYNNPDIANNDGTSGQGFFIGNPSERNFDRSSNYIAQLVNIDNRNIIGDYVQGLKVTLGKPFGAPLIPPTGNTENSITNFYVHCEEANTTGIESKGGIAPDSNGVGLYLYGSDYSDRRLKENITLSEDGLNIVQKLKVKKFNFIGSDIVERGLIAQEVQEIIPEAVRSGMKHLELKWSKITPYLIKAIQQQQDQIESLQNQIDELKQLIK